jgi:hypothetical protein
MTNKSICICFNPANAYWRIGILPPTGDAMLFGWCFPNKQVDCGVPKEVRDMLVSAIISISRVSFPISEAPHEISQTWCNCDKDQVRLLGMGNVVDRVEAMLKGTPSNITFLSTRRRETAVKAFEDAWYSWHLQSQIILLSAPDAAPPEIDRWMLLSLINGDWTMRIMDHLRSTGILCILRPGVDGDVIGMIPILPEFKNTLLETLMNQARRTQFDWLLLSEQDFTDKLCC